MSSPVAKPDASKNRLKVVFPGPPGGPKLQAIQALIEEIEERRAEERSRVGEGGVENSPARPQEQAA